ncbi:MULTISPECIES: heavy metal sensor histidine kinase IrlS [Burkholderia]|uniref:heavy metal sensor histidine kinase IrlS n=1 Tax=Burkholderia TaxID=32008 RepID=UPI000756A16A|nr:MULTISPECIES: heavy metal sensor histidine kinase IrlS [Burkholderia]AOJ71612.1 histidine kinase [Burkholderia savannae]KVG47637.1 histidine kinase [Burkholderia sp. MSMB0265]KVG80523.1 histidine kinase [Burkholderia sp. MSMB2040]KVG93945.1 histidine kinase [Burkholderia sp. MSMB2042]KVG96588.1 histidine kinase [Burkholderia sp. MSMB2041]
MIKRLLPRTLRARLTALIILSTAATLALSGIALYSALHNRLAGMSSYEMSATLAAMRTHLVNVRSVDEIPRKSDLWIDQLHGHQNLDLAIYGADGRMLFATRGFVATQPALGAPQARVPASATHAGTTYSYLAGDAPLRDANRTARIVVQYDGRNDHALLRAYAYTVVVIEVLAVALTAALAYGIAMLGLSPLRRLVSRAEQMSSSRLAHPLPELHTSGELKEMEHAFNGMLKRLDESFVRLSQFSSNLAHDMRTPLTNLLAEAQVALSKPRTADEYRDVIESSIDEYQRLSRMIEDMLFLARSDNAESHLAIRTLDAAAEAERVAGYYEPMAEDAEVNIVVRGQAAVQADALLYHRALSNLISNALNHAPRGSTITIECRQAGGATTISVSDTGRGIEPQHRERIFERFYRVDPARHNSASGTGLGLAIVRSIMDNHGGACGVDSEPHVRTTFWLTFPAHAA